MNVKITKGNNQTPKHIKAQYMAAAAGFTLAASALLLSTPWHDETVQHTDMKAVSMAHLQASHAGVADSKGEPIDEYAAREAAQIQLLESKALGSDSDFMARVVSREHDTYVFDAAPGATARPASDTDIPAAVLSTEQDAWPLVP